MGYLYYNKKLDQYVEWHKYCGEKARFKVYKELKMTRSQTYEFVGKVKKGKLIGKGVEHVKT